MSSASRFRVVRRNVPVSIIEEKFNSVGAQCAVNHTNYLTVRIRHSEDIPKDRSRSSVEPSSRILGIGKPCWWEEEIFEMKILVVMLTVIVAVSPENLPSSWKTCDKADPKFYTCIADAITDAVTSLAGGLKSFKILPIEPLAVDKIKIAGTPGSVSVTQEYKNIKLHGLTKGLVLKNYRIDWDKQIWTSESYNPQVDFVGDYKIDGKILLLPITGSGKSNITMYDLVSQNTIYCEQYQKDGEEYLRVKKYAIKFSPGRVTMQFDNLFGGDSVLGEQMNKFINDNSQLLFKELQAPYEESFGLVFAKISNEIFSRVPLSKIFPHSSDAQ
ncbi:hypothetical protein KM043_003758 [Ampulex compressa]|nr:hypothetical protein KM043_003758 [Ampulex compressa]